MRYLAPIAFTALVLLAGCLSTDQRQALLDDAAVTRDLVTAIVPAGPKRDALLKDLAAAQTAEALIQVRAKAAQAATQPVGN